ncbi:hypothetical protein [Microbacterium sp.]|uniref:hypothetical protein n=1 Tax=Microbacterium sp. TaxID=51671 RepID=UPI0028123D05|nr:hypothetical protein [Microbacterium sp.]
MVHDTRTIDPVPPAGPGQRRALRELVRTMWATVACFVLGAAAGTVVLWGADRPFSGDG